MRLRSCLHPAAALLLVACLGAGGCAFTENAIKKRVPKPGPVVKTGASAVMPAVQDNRRWPKDGDGQAISHIRIFSPEMTTRLRETLVKLGTFDQLARPDTEKAQDLSGRLEVSVAKFELTQMDTNGWVAPHLVLNGLALPLFGLGLFATAGQVDLGGYVFPSSEMSTTVNFTAAYKEEGLIPPKISHLFMPVGAESPVEMRHYTPVLTRSYQVQVPLFAMSGFQYMSGYADSSQHGVQVGLAKGEKALNLMVQTIARDPHWTYLADFRLLTKVKSDLDQDESMDWHLHRAMTLVKLIRPLGFVPDEVGILQDGYLDQKKQAAIVNDMRCRWFQVPEPNKLPKAEFLTPAKARALFDDPALQDSMVKVGLARQALRLSFDTLVTSAQDVAAPAGGKVSARAAGAPASPLRTAPPVPLLKPSTQTPSPTPPVRGANAKPAKKAAKADPAKVRALRGQLMDAMAARFRDHIRLQLILLEEADRVRGEAWKSMMDLLHRVDSPQTKAFLSQRLGKKADS